MVSFMFSTSWMMEDDELPPICSSASLISCDLRSSSCLIFRAWSSLDFSSERCVRARVRERTASASFSCLVISFSFWSGHRERRWSWGSCRRKAFRRGRTHLLRG